MKTVHSWVTGISRATRTQFLERHIAVEFFRCHVGQTKFLKPPCTEVVLQALTHRCLTASASKTNDTICTARWFTNSETSLDQHVSCFFIVSERFCFQGLRVGTGLFPLRSILPPLHVPSLMNFHPDSFLSGAPLCRLHKARLLLCATSCNVGQGGFTRSISFSIVKKTILCAGFEFQLMHSQIVNWRLIWSSYLGTNQIFWWGVVQFCW